MSSCISHQFNQHHKYLRRQVNHCQHCIPSLPFHCASLNIELKTYSFGGEALIFDLTTVLLFYFLYFFTFFTLFFIPEIDYSSTILYFILNLCQYFTKEFTFISYFYSYLNIYSIASN
jgi:hypothetical protein